MCARNHCQGEEGQHRKTFNSCAETKANLLHSGFQIMRWRAADVQRPPKIAQTTKAAVFPRIEPMSARVTPSAVLAALAFLMPLQDLGRLYALRRRILLASNAVPTLP